MTGKVSRTDKDSLALKLVFGRWKNSDESPRELSQKYSAPIVSSLTYS